MEGGYVKQADGRWIWKRPDEVLVEAHCAEGRRKTVIDVSECKNWWDLMNTVLNGLRRDNTEAFNHAEIVWFGKVAWAGQTWETVYEAAETVSARPGAL